jgi:hypothetical protein
MRELVSDAGVLFCSHACGNLLGTILSYVDDLIITGCFEFLEKSQAIDRRFKSRPRQTNIFTHAGVDIRREQNLNILSNTGYAERMQRVQKTCNYETFRSARAKLQWLVNTRPDVSGSVSLLAQVTPEQYEQYHAKHNAEVNRIIRYVQSNPYVLTYLPLDLPSARLVVYADASYAANTDRSSQIGYTISLVDRSDICHLLAYSSKKSPRVVTSIFSGEAIALALAFSHAYIM